MTQHNSLPDDALNTPKLSHRALQAKKTANPAFEAVLAKVFGDQYSPDNPNGLVNAGVAENSLMSDWLLEEYKSLMLDYTDLTYGNSLTGSNRLFGHVSTFMNHYFSPIKPIKPEHIAGGVGVSAVLDQLSEKICDPGDAILIATPYYNGFDNDLTARAAVKPIGVDIPEGVHPASPEILEAFELKMVELKKVGQAVRAVIMCNPNNPQGFIHPKETILAYCRFCEKHNLHLISDEIYALSLFKNPNITGTDMPTFQSILSIDVRKEADCNPARVHVLYGMSKDFGSNGLRLGVLVTQHNKDVMDTLGFSAILMKISSPSDALWSGLLGDEKKLTWYIDEAQSRAADALAYAFSWLDKMGIPHSNPVAGHFIWIDLTSYLPKKAHKDGKKLHTPEEQEADLFDRLLYKHNVYVAAGAFYHSPKPGYFRLTFTLKRYFMEEALKRFEQGLQEVKRENSEQ